MKKVSTPVLLAVMAVLLVILLPSCYTEQSLGRRFVKKTALEPPAIWFVGASSLFRTCNLEPDSNEYPCAMLATVNDSSVLELYNSTFARMLSVYGYKVFNYDEADTFLAYPGARIIVNIAQLELEEVKEYHHDTEVFDTLEYHEHIPIRAFNINSWIEISIHDTTKSTQEVFFATNKITDLIEGYFTQRPLSGEVFYTFRRYNMRPELIGKFISGSSKEHVQKLFDVWMNRYIRKFFAETTTINVVTGEKAYYRYNPEKKRVEQVSPSHALQKL